MVPLARADLQVTPALLVVAALAVASEPSAVNIVEVVAGGAFGGLTGGSLGGPGVAAQASKPLVATAQWEGSFAVVVKAPKRPAVRIVAVPAVGAELSSVCVIAVVAGDARLFCVTESRRLVAGFAGFDGVEAEQRKRGDLVIESDSFSPTFLIVTLRAVAAQAARVRIVAAVAVDAVARDFHAVRVAGMAVLAGNVGVSSSKRKLRLSSVIEGGSCPTPFRVAVFTIGTVAAPVGVVGGVTADAARFQLLFFERPIVAGAAFGLRVAMEEREARLRAVVENRLRPALW